jgi:predicted nucleotidyltransferase
MIGLSLIISKSDIFIVEQLKAKLQEITPMESLVVYGSCARGDSSLDSDLDIYIEVPRISPELRRDISEIAWEIGFKNSIIISTFVVTLEDINEGPIGAHPLVIAVKSEGIPV